MCVCVYACLSRVQIKLERLFLIFFRFKTFSVLVPGTTTCTHTYVIIRCVVSLGNSITTWIRFRWIHDNGAPAPLLCRFVPICCGARVMNHKFKLIKDLKPGERVGWAPGWINVCVRVALEYFSGTFAILQKDSLECCVLAAIHAAYVPRWNHFWDWVVTRSTENVKFA